MAQDLLNDSGHGKPTLTPFPEIAYLLLVSCAKLFLCMRSELVEGIDDVASNLVP